MVGHLNIIPNTRQCKVRHACEKNSLRTQMALWIPTLWVILASAENKNNTISINLFSGRYALDPDEKKQRYGFNSFGMKLKFSSPFSFPISLALEKQLTSGTLPLHGGGSAR